MALTRNFFAKIPVFFGMIRFEHTLFALPFAYLGLFLAERGIPRGRIFFWVTVAMVGLRTAGMTYNRIVDRKWDALNPRTRDWALPQGKLSVKFSCWAFLTASGFYFWAAYELNALCAVLSPVPFAMIVIYPWLKRLTFLSHFFLGMILGAAPVGGWIASREAFSIPVFLLLGAVCCWVAGFDMIYSLQDADFDREYHLHSFPARFGRDATVWVARGLHLLTLIFMAGLGRAIPLGKFYWSGLLLAAVFLLREHWIVFRKGSEGIQEAFFCMNAMVSVTFFLAVFFDLMLS
ncbi:MAG TPA: UbiA-like polyprenyltransferase [Candidatus Omnitrophota bacterium]|nr:UbiA-like polyprenyltransferase [Candidatus Omnitrophota bacterium]